MKPKNGSVQNALFGVATRGGQTQRAATKAVAALQGDLKKITGFLQDNRMADALKFGLVLLKQYPKSPHVLNLMGAVFSKNNQVQNAIKCLEKAVRLDPKFVEAYNNLGNCLNSAGDADAGAKAFAHAIKLRPNYGAAHHNLGNYFRALGDPITAIKHYKVALKENPKHVGALNGLGTALKFIGQIDAARSAYEKALEAAPNSAISFKNLSTTKDFSLRDPAVVRFRELAANPTLPDADKIHLNFALGAIGEHNDETQTAFRFYSDGNALRKKQVRYDTTQDERLFDAIKSFATSLSNIRLPKPENKRPTPIFIVGMPRSGTTLVEQIISSHPDVHGAGELTGLGKMIGPKVKDGKAFAENDLQDIRTSYLDQACRFSADAKYVTDKMPLNFRWIGFIRAMFPEAPIICLDRDPMAVAWSIFKLNFTGPGNGFGHDLEDLHIYYRRFLDLMEFYNTQSPAAIYGLNYHALTENQETETRALIDFCGLGWDDACLAFEQNTRSVATASATQVRRGMYQGSSQAWRKFEDVLGTYPAKFAELRPLTNGRSGLLS